MSDRKKVLLIYPGNIKSITKRMPLSILFLAESLIEKGFDPVLLDMQVDQFDEKMLDNVVCVGISTLTGEQIKYGLSIATAIRACNPHIPLVWGGIHPSIMPEQTARHDLVDYVMCGEGEEAFPKLVQALLAGSDLSTVPNLRYEQDGTYKTTPNLPFLLFNKSNNLPYDLLSLPKYQTNTRIEYQSSRGCPHGCLFCYNKGFNAFKWRAKDSAIVLDELDKIEKRFNPEYLFFVDDEFFINRKRAQEIVTGMIARGFDFKWKATIRIDTLNTYDQAMLDLLDKSGFMEMAMGAESGSDKILNLVKKKIKRSDIVASAQRLAQSRMIPQYSFMSGFPTETIQDLHQTLDCMDELWSINKSIKVNGLFFATPFPGTELFDLAIQNGYKPPQDLAEWADIDFILSYKNVPYIPRSFTRELVVFSFIVRFRYLWMHTATFLNNPKNRSSAKYWGFVAFRVIFMPVNWIFSWRWRTRFTAVPLDVFAVRMLLSKIAA
ncbi:MAG: radical SAM protein [Chitinivibrionales bacterium]|nr:radical SAM protein [Chitinivibrionales bacterium]